MTVRYRTIDYKKIPSWIEHKSPTDEEYGAALRAKTTPSLAVDRDRYIDFISAKGTLSRIAYPNFYRLIWNAEEDLTAEKVRARVKELLDAKSTEINALISRENPS